MSMSSRDDSIVSGLKVNRGLTTSAIVKQLTDMNADLMNQLASAQICQGCTRKSDKYFPVGIQSKTIETLLDNVTRLKSLLQESQAEVDHLRSENVGLAERCAKIESNSKHVNLIKQSEKRGSRKTHQLETAAALKEFEGVDKKTRISPFVVKLEENKEMKDIQHIVIHDDKQTNQIGDDLLYNLESEDDYENYSAKFKKIKDFNKDRLLGKSKRVEQPSPKAALNQTPHHTEDSSYANIDVMMYRDFETDSTNRLLQDVDHTKKSSSQKNPPILRTNPKLTRHIKAPLKSKFLQSNDGILRSSKTEIFSSTLTLTKNSYDIKNVLQNYDFIRSMIIEKHRSSSRKNDLDIPKDKPSKIRQPQGLHTSNGSERPFRYYLRNFPRQPSANSFLDSSCRPWLKQTTFFGAASSVNV